MDYDSGFHRDYSGGKKPDPSLKADTARWDHDLPGLTATLVKVALAVVLVGLFLPIVRQIGAPLLQLAVIFFSIKAMKAYKTTMHDVDYAKLIIAILLALSGLALVVLLFGSIFESAPTLRYVFVVIGQLSLPIAAWLIHSVCREHAPVR